MGPRSVALLGPPTCSLQPGHPLLTAIILCLEPHHCECAERDTGGLCAGAWFPVPHLTHCRYLLSIKLMN